MIKYIGVNQNEKVKTIKNEWSNKEMEISLKDLILILFKRLWLIILCTLIGLISAFAISKFVIDPQYTSNVRIYVNTAKNNTGTVNPNNINELTYQQKIVKSYIIMLETNTFREEVIKKSGVNISPNKLGVMSKMNIVETTEIFDFSAITNKPEDSYKIAKAFQELAPAEIFKITGVDSLAVLDSAILPSKPSSPNIITNSMIGALLGLAIAVFSAYVVEILDVRIKDEDDLGNHYNIPVLGCVPKIESLKKEGVSN